MNDATASWSKPITGNPATSYTLIWTQNGTALPPTSVPSTAAGDAAGYTSDFATANPTATVNPGDTIGVTIQPIDATDSLVGPVSSTVPATVTIPSAPVAPGPVVNPTLVLS